MIQPLKINKKVDNDAKLAQIIKENIPASEFMSADEVNSMVGKINEMVPAINVSNGGFQGVLEINEKRVDSGFYIPTESGTFINAGNVVVDLSQGINFVTYDGDKWDVAVVPIVADGQIQEGDTGFVSGGEVYDVSDMIINGSEKSYFYNKWEPGYYYNDGSINKESNYGLERTPKFLLKAGEKLFFGVNTFETQGSSAIFNTYNLDGKLIENVLKGKDFLNTFKEFEYISEIDVLCAIVNNTQLNLGTKYIKINKVLSSNLKSLSENIDTINNGGIVYDARKNQYFTEDGYYRLNGDTTIGIAYGNKRTPKFLLKSGRTLRYGINAYTLAGTVGMVSVFNLNGTFKYNHLKSTEDTKGTFIEGFLYTDEDVLVGVVDYFEGNYKQAYCYIDEYVEERNGLLYLLERDKESDNNLKNTSDIESNNIYNRGSTSVNNSNNKKIGLIVAGQSNADGRVPILELPDYIKNNNNTVPNVQMWDDGSKTFLPFKYGVNTGGGIGTSKSNMYAFDAITSYKLAEYLNKDIYLIKRSLGGTAISIKGSNGGGYWQPYDEQVISGNKLILELKNRVLNALFENKDLDIKAIIWHQGEGDATELASKEYYQNFKNLIYYIRGIVRNPKLIFVFGTISHKSAQYNKTVEEVQIKLSQELDFVYYVDMKDADLLDSWHFNAKYTIQLGESMFEILKDKI